MRYFLILLIFNISLVCFGQPKADSLKKTEPKDSLLLKSCHTLDLFFNKDTLQTQSLQAEKVINRQPYSQKNPFLNNGNQGLAPFSLVYQPEEQLNFEYFSHAAILNSNENQATESFLTASPYTELFYANGSKNQHHFYVFHSQNFRRYLNTGFKYSVWNSDGMAYKQVTNHRNFRWYIAYNNPKKRWKTYGDVFFNKLNLDENGGLDSANLFEQHAQNVTTNYAVNLLESHLKYQSLKLRWMNKYELIRFSDSTSNKTKTLSIYQSSSLTKKYSLFTSNLLDNDFYLQTLLDTLKTHDSTACLTTKNEIGFFSNGGFIFGLLNAKASYSVINDHFYQVTTKELKSSLINIEVSTPEFKKHYLVVNYETAISGWRKNDRSVNFKYIFTINKYSILKAGALAKQALPVYYYSYLNTNHLFLDSKLPQEKTSSISVEYSHKKNRFLSEISGSINAIQIVNPTIFGDSCLPVSYHENVNGFIGKGQIAFEVKGWGLKPQIWIQKYDNDKIFSFPFIIGKASLWKEFYIAKKAAKARIGVDGFWFSEYYAPSYMPSTGIYYTQSIKKTGNYPMIDLYLSLQIKRARLFVKSEHFNQGMMGYNYMGVYGYPLQGRSLKFGVSWIMLN